MKRILIILFLSAAALIAAFSIPSRNDSSDRAVPDSEGHVLTQLWKEYRDCEKADLPLRQLAVLDRIRVQAAARRLHRDFFDAATLAVEVGISRNWKDSDSLRKDLERRIYEYDEPIVTYSFRSRSGENGLTDFVLASESRLRTGRNTAFYSGLSLPDRAVEQLVPDLVKDDFEYCLWDRCARSEHFNPEGKAFRTLDSLCSGRYPLEQYLEYRSLLFGKSRDRCCEALPGFAEEHRGQALRLLALGEYVFCLKDSLDRENAPSEAYEDLLRLCRSCEAERKAFRSGADRLLASGVDAFSKMTEILERKAVACEAVQDSLKVILRNVPSASLNIRTDSSKPLTIFKTTLASSGRRLYVPDTVSVALPGMDDGDYLIEVRGGGVKDVSAYSRRSLSIAARQEADGKDRIFVADSRTGEPLETVGLEYFRSGELVCQAEGFVLDGFTPLPDSFRKRDGDAAPGTVVASFTGPDGFLRKSPEWGMLYPSPSSRDGGKSLPGCSIFTDKAAYNPGETLRFKAVLYLADAVNPRVIGQDCPVTVTLKDSEGKEAGSLQLMTNEYGSVAGGFLLPEGRRNGSFRVEVSFSAPGSTARTVHSRTVVVDEFVLPNYLVVFEPSEELRLAGDTVSVRGSVRSLTGHRLAAASAAYEVREYSRTLLSGSLPLDDEGSFLIRFPSDASRKVSPYSVVVRVTDSTGETVEGSSYVPVYGMPGLSVDILNESRARVRVSSGDWTDVRTVSGPEAEVLFSCTNPDGTTFPLPVAYTLCDSGGRTVASGTVISGEAFVLGLPSAGAYSLKMEAEAVSLRGDTVRTSNSVRLLRFDDTAEVLDAPFENVFSLVGPCRDGVLEKGGDIRLKIGAGDGPVWMLVELFGDRKQLLEKRFVRLDGVQGREGSVEDVVFKYREDYPDALLLNVFYFRKGEAFTYSESFTAKRREPAVGLSFSRFEDKALPNARYEVSLSAGNDLEAVAAVFDKSSEEICSNVWRRSLKLESGADRVPVRYWCGRTVCSGTYIGNGLPLMALAMDKPRLTKSGVFDAAPAAGGALSLESDTEPDETEPGTVRSDFSTSLAFEPFLRPDAEGKLGFSFETSGKLSTFVVQVYAHDKSLRDTLLRREFIVSLPVKVALAQPDYLYKGDRLTLGATVTSQAAEPVDGVVTLSLFDSGDWRSGKPFRTYSKKVNVPAGSVLPLSFDLRPAEGDSLGILLSFTAAPQASGKPGGEFSDRVFVKLPVKDDSQVITESHSAVLLPDMDRDGLLKQLRSGFTGTSSYGASYSETDIREMLLAALPDKLDPDCKDIVSVTGALYVRRVAASLGAEVSGEYSDEKLLEMAASCRNADGGFGWFPGMKSSPVMTAIVLERYSRLSGLGLATSSFDPAPSVSYLDRTQFLYESGMPYWSGVLSAEQYIFVRSLFPEIAFELSSDTASGQLAASRNFKEFKTFASQYLAPSGSDGRGLQGRILQKARRVATLLNLTSSEGGAALAAAWGVKSGTEAKLRASLSADVLSLVEYAVSHPGGGWYYPDAVMPSRGLLENELYAHTLLCDIFDDDYVRTISTSAALPSPSELSEGIRLWIMLQKETQNWGIDPAFTDAVGTVLRGGESVLDTRVVSLSKTYRKEFAGIGAAGNGFSVERRFFREVPSQEGSVREEIAEGEILGVGDRIFAEYRIRSDENRSFVRLTAPREAAFRPVGQLSGLCGLQVGVLRPGGSFLLVPQAYRNVKSDCTEYYFDVCPEEKTVITEAFFVTREGSFKAPVLTVESLYAPHYRANDAFSGIIRTSF
ncbi:MAG: MG2 domain-containing protein [Candidatus Cryptobacteroides sp.]